MSTSEALRVLHVCQRDDPDTGGSLRVAEALIREQRAAGIEAWFLFLYGPPAGMAAAYGPNVHCLGLASSREALHGIGRLAKALRTLQPNIIHSHDGILWPRLAYLGCGIPVVAHAHLPPDVSGGLKQVLGWPLIKRTSTRLVGISQHTADKWLAAGYPSARLQIIPNGVDPSRFEQVDASAKAALRRKLGLPVDVRMLLWVGRLHREMKGTDRVERIAAALPARTVLVVVGNGPEHAGMAERGRTLVAEGTLVLVGTADRPEEYYMAADAYLFTSYHEAFGLVILEAAACGLPILSFPVTEGGGAVELLDEFEALEIDDNDSPEQLCERVEEVFARSDRGAVLREKVEGHTWAAISARTVALYNTLLDGGAA